MRLEITRSFGGSALGRIGIETNNVGSCSTVKYCFSSLILIQFLSAILVHWYKLHSFSAIYVAMYPMQFIVNQ